MSETINALGPWVDVIFVEDWSDEAQSAGIDARLSSALSAEDVQAIAEHLSSWDQGDETDAARTHGETAPWGWYDDLYPVTVGVVAYVLSVNAGLDYVSLNRRPIGVEL